MEARNLEIMLLLCFLVCFVFSLFVFSFVLFARVEEKICQFFFSTGLPVFDKENLSILKIIRAVNMHAFD